MYVGYKCVSAFSENVYRAAAMLKCTCFIPDSSTATSESSSSLEPSSNTSSVSCKSNIYTLQMVRNVLPAREPQPAYLLLSDKYFLQISKDLQLSNKMQYYQPLKLSKWCFTLWKFTDSVSHGGITWHNTCHSGIPTVYWTVEYDAQNRPLLNPLPRVVCMPPPRCW